MKFFALACDFDGTLAERGAIASETAEMLERFAGSGRKLILVTGRELEDLKRVCPQLNFFSWVVAENGALIYCPRTKEERLLAKAPPEEFFHALQDKGVEPLTRGRVIVATLRPHDRLVLETISRLGLELQVIFNKESVMVLPSGVNKQSGLGVVLDELKLSAHNVIAVGDGENDHALLTGCEAAVAVANAVPMLKQTADVVTEEQNGAGVRQLVGWIMKDDFAQFDPRLSRHDLLVGRRRDRQPVFIPSGRVNLLVAGTTGAGKSTFANSFLERLVEKDYQFCVIDPEGDYQELEDAVPFGDSTHPPQLDAVLRLLRDPRQNASINLNGLPFKDRPEEFMKILVALQELRTEVGRPHWIIVDEAHHVLPSSWEAKSFALPADLQQTVFVTLEPNLLARPALEKIALLLVAGKQPEQTIQLFCETVGVASPNMLSEKLEHGEMLVWNRKGSAPPFSITVLEPRMQGRRHSRKYAEGELEPERSFYFEGPGKKLHLRAQNLILFLQIGDGVDDDTWMYHFRRGDYSRWFAEKIKNDELAARTKELEQEKDISPSTGKRQLRALVEGFYTLPEPARRVADIAP